MMHCNICGHEINDELKCPECGYPTPLQMAKEKIREEISPICGYRYGVLLTIFLAIFGFILSLILGDRECRKGALSVIFIYFMIILIFLLLTCII